MRALAGAALLCSAVALANPRPLPFSYPYETLVEKALEVEQFVDLSPVPAYDPLGRLTWLPRAVLTTEIEYGVTAHLELGLYFQLSNDTGSSNGSDPLRFDGNKQRLRYRLAEQGDWPIDVSLYGELAELSNEFELEAKVNLQRRFGPVRVLVNLWAEREFYFSGVQEWVLHPTAGVTWEVRPWLHLGVEYWMNAELGGPGAASFNGQPHHFLGPAVMVQFRKLWWTVAPYVRLDGFGRSAQLGDFFGRVWIRSVLGIDL